MIPDPRAEALHIVDHLSDGVVRAVFRALIRDRDPEARARLAAAGQPADVADPDLREWLLEALEYRISPPDDDDLGLTRPTGSSTLALELAA
ncbi:MAG: hypothetical protein ABMA64_39275 [Myxococcota bacterium]